METEQSKLPYKQWFYVATITIAVLFFINLYQGCESNRALASKDKMYEAISNSLKTWKDKRGLSYSEKKIVETKDPNEFLAIQTKDKEILSLQALVKQYKGQLGKQGSVTHFAGEIVVDTFYTKPIIQYVDKSFYKDSIVNKWIDWKYKVKRDIKDSIDFKLKLNYEYAIINKEKSNGLFKKPTPYAEVVNFNPYSKTVSLTTYRVVNDIKTRKFGIGIIGGYGALLTTEPNLGWFIGAGGSYNLIRF